MLNRLTVIACTESASCICRALVPWLTDTLSFARSMKSKVNSQSPILKSSVPAARGSTRLVEGIRERERERHLYICCK